MRIRIFEIYSLIAGFHEFDHFIFTKVWPPVWSRTEGTLCNFIDGQTLSTMDLFFCLNEAPDILILMQLAVTRSVIASHVTGSSSLSGIKHVFWASLKYQLAKASLFNSYFLFALGLFMDLAFKMDQGLSSHCLCLFLPFWPLEPQVFGA